MVANHGEEPEAYARFMADPAIPYRGGESSADVLRRVEAAFDELWRRHTGEAFVVVAHNVVNRVYLSALTETGLEHSRKIRQTNCCINLISHEGDAPKLITMNSVFHLSEW